MQRKFKKNAFPQQKTGLTYIFLIPAASSLCLLLLALKSYIPIGLEQPLIEAGLCGAFISLALPLVFCFGMTKQNLRESLKKTAFIKAVIGTVVVSIFSFMLSESLTSHQFFKEYWFCVLSSQRWFISSMTFLVLFSYFQKRSIFLHQQFPLILLLQAGLAILIEHLIYHMLPPESINWVLVFIVYSISGVTSLYLFEQALQHSYFKILNGPHAGECFELREEVSVIGNSPDNAVNLEQYENINSQHARVIRYGTSNQYTVVDNDPNLNTWVNFRPFREQLIKNGDIIKLGNAKLQFCRI